MLQNSAILLYHKIKMQNSCIRFFILFKITMTSLIKSFKLEELKKTSSYYFKFLYGLDFFYVFLPLKIDHSFIGHSSLSKDMMNNRWSVTFYKKENHLLKSAGNLSGWVELIDTGILSIYEENEMRFLSNI